MELGKVAIFYAFSNAIMFFRYIYISIDLLGIVREMGL